MREGVCVCVRACACVRPSYLSGGGWPTSAEAAAAEGFGLRILSLPFGTLLASDPWAGPTPLGWVDPPWVAAAARCGLPRMAAAENNTNWEKVFLGPSVCSF